MGYRILTQKTTLLRLYSETRYSALNSYIPLFKEIKPEDIENVSSHFLPLFQESRDSDTVNKIRIGNSEIYLIALIEHQSENDFDMSFRILRYIVFIWTDYAAQQECPR